MIYLIPSELIFLSSNYDNEKKFPSHVRETKYFVLRTISYIKGKDFTAIPFCWEAAERLQLSSNVVGLNFLFSIAVYFKRKNPEFKPVSSK